MKHFVLILFLNFTYSAAVLSQQYPGRATIDSLIKILPSLKDTAKVTCLNKLSVEYYINALAETYYNANTDTANLFATQAYNESVRINYTRGIADALQNLGEICRDRSECSKAVDYFRRSIPLFDKIHALDRSAWAHITLGWCLYMQDKFSEAKSSYEESLAYYVKVDNKERQSMTYRLISLTYSRRGYYEKAFENTLKAIRITYKISDARGIISSPENLANLYKDAGETETALAYFRLAANNAKAINPVRYYRLNGDITTLLQQFDSAKYYYNKSHDEVRLMTSDSVLIKRDLAYTSLYCGENYTKQRQYDLAIEQLRIPLLFFEKGNNINGVMRTLQLLARCYLMQKNIERCFLYAKRLLKIAQETGARPYLRDAYELYWKIYDHGKQTDSAYFYNLKYTSLKDSILSDEYRRNIALSEMKTHDEEQKTKIGLLEKEQQLNTEKLTLQQKEIKSESLVRYILIATTGAFVLIAFFIFRNVNLKRKNEKQRLEHALALQQVENQKSILELQQQATELEMQALRAQMNPHFIFNCLSSINRFILINKVEEASDYLTKFSRLIRMALHNSGKQLITLENEIDALRLYLDLERLRFKNAFNYSITFINTIDVNAVYIPPMLIQPFAENAIWHGLMHKKGIGQLDIQLCAEAKILTCTIIDNGVGRNMAATFKSRSAEKNKSMGVDITAGRLALLNKSTSEAALFNLEDLVDEDGIGCGTKVVLTMPYKELTEVAI